MNISENEKILIIQCEDKRDALSYQLRYYQNDNYNILYSNYFDQYPSVEDYNDLLKQYDYLYVLTVNDDYVKNYWNETVKEDLWEYALYRISSEDGKLQLELVKIEYL